MSKRKWYVSRAVPLIVLVLVLLIGAVAFTPLAQRAQRFEYIITKKLLVLNNAEVRGDVVQSGDLTVTGDTVLGDSATEDTLTVTGNTTISGARDAATGYDYFTTISGDFTGVGANAKTYGLYIDVERTVANTHGNIDEAGAKIRYKTSATSRTAGIVASGADIEAKTDDGHHAGTLRGAQITAVSDASATTDAQIGLRVHAEVDTGATATALQIADFELNRKSAVEPTTEYGINVRNTSSAGTGADVGYRLESSYGAGGATANADWVYGIDLSPADIVTADIRLSNSETIANTTDGTIDIGGNVVVAGARDDTTGYDYFVTVEGEASGVVTGSKTIGMIVELERSSTYPIALTGDLADTGLMVRVETEATSTTAGTVLRAVDAEAKADNPGGTVSNLFGGSFTAKSDTSAGSVDSMIGLQSNVQNNATVGTTLISADFRLMRQAATEPTTEQIVRIRNSSTSGNGVDAGLYFASDASNAYDDFDYVIDMSGADVDDADIRLSNGETISNVTDTAVQVGGFLALTEGSVVEIASGGTITPLASYQPIETSESGSTTTDTTTAIADGAVAGAMLILCNEDAQDIVIDDGANTDIGGNQTLTGGAGDCLWLIWNGSDWNKIAEIGDN